MRTGLFLVAGFLMLAASLVLGRLFSTNYPGATSVATVAYVALWFAIAAANMWVGVAKAVPIFALIFTLPAAVAILLKWKLP